MTSIKNNSFEVLDKRMDALDSTLKVCTFNKNKIEALFSKKQTSHTYYTKHGHHRKACTPSTKFT